MIIEIPNVSAIAKDNRTNRIKGVLSRKRDIEEAFRFLCAHFGKEVGATRAFLRMKSDFNIRGLVGFCKNQDVLVVVDNANDFFFIKYADKDVPQLEVSKAEEVLEGGLEEKAPTEGEDGDELPF